MTIEYQKLNEYARYWMELVQIGALFYEAFGWKDVRSIVNKEALKK